MKKRILITFVCLACLIISSAFVLAQKATADQEIAINTYFKMEILDDGKLTDNKMLVELRMFSDGSDIYADWNHVYIDPVDETKTVILKAQHFSTLEGSIKNVIAKKIIIDMQVFKTVTFVIVSTKILWRKQIRKNAIWSALVMLKKNAVAKNILLYMTFMDIL